MATRPVKTGGNTAYVTEVAGGNTVIKASEVDADLAEIYSNINNSNVAPAAGIVYSKLTLTNSIVTGDLTALSVTNPKMAAGAATSSFVTATPGISVNINNGEGVIATLPTFTPRGGRVVLFGKPGLSVANTGVVALQASIRLYKNTGGAGFALLATWITLVGQSGATSIEVPIYLPEFSEIPTSATQIYEWRGFSPSTSLTFHTHSASTGAVYAVELT